MHSTLQSTLESTDLEKSGRWAGRIYNADDGGIYESKIALLGPKQLRVEGCLGAFCGGETWTKLGGR